MQDKIRTIYTLNKTNFSNPGTYVAHEFNTDTQVWEVMFEK